MGMSGTCSRGGIRGNVSSSFPRNSEILRHTLAQKEKATSNPAHVMFQSGKCLKDVPGAVNSILKNC